jgi:hypothetical protein
MMPKKISREAGAGFYQSKYDFLCSTPAIVSHKNQKNVKV